MNILERLRLEPLRKELMNHSLLLEMRREGLKLPQLIIVLAQWYHPLHYFPVFLARLIAILPQISMQTSVSKILWQELGEGRTDQAHEMIYQRTMQSLLIKAEQFVNCPLLPATQALLSGYRQATEQNYLAGLGFAFGTEAADLAMVSSIGKAAARFSAKPSLEWVDIHIKQEPMHTDCMDDALQAGLDQQEEEEVIVHAKKMWELWINFFSAIHETIMPVHVATE